MTTNDEEIRALKNISIYLQDLILMKTIKERRELVRTLLRHYPSTVLIDLYWKKESEQPCKHCDVPTSGH